MAAVLAHLSAILLALAGTRAYIHSRDVAIDHVVLLLQALPLCLARAYIVHVRLFITGCLPRPRVNVCLKEGMHTTSISSSKHLLGASALNLEILQFSGYAQALTCVWHIHKKPRQLCLIIHTIWNYSGCALLVHGKVRWYSLGALQHMLEPCRFTASCTLIAS